jgi:hypothetical protein
MLRAATTAVIAVRGAQSSGDSTVKSDDRTARKFQT